MKRGFTLVEIGVVLAILGIAAAVALPTLWREARPGDVDLAMAELSQVAGAARRAALTRAVTVELIIDPLGRRYWATVREPGAEPRPLSDGALRLPASVSLQGHRDRARFGFGPLGGGYGDTLFVRGSAGRARFLLDPWTGDRLVDDP